MKNSFKLLTGFILTGFFVGVFIYYNSAINTHKFEYKEVEDASVIAVPEVDVDFSEELAVEDIVAVQNVETPDVMRAIYATMWSISSDSRRKYLIDLIDRTDLNSIIIDVKGSGGELVFESVPHIKEIVDELHRKNIYVIARVVVFQDNGLAKISPEFSLKDKNGDIWRDRKGYAYSDPSAKGVWDYNVGIAKQAIDIGFDEINYDYIRFATDGKLDDIVYPFWDGTGEKSDVIKNFGAYSKKELKTYKPEVKLSLDIFGYTFLRGDGLGIGQKLEDMLDNFDYVYPMVYPSHFGPGNFGFANPAEFPYEVVKRTLDQGLDSLGEKKDVVKSQIRPWIQVFDLGAKYTPEMVEAQIKATYDALGTENTGWLMWSPSNNYDEVLEIEL